MKNKDSVWIFPHSTKYYLKHPLVWFRDVYWNLKEFIHRGKYGFVEMDLCDWSSWWVSIGANALKYMANHGTGFYEIAPYDTFEKWQKHMYEIAEKLEQCKELMRFDSYNNEYEEQMDEIRDRYYCRKETKDGFMITYLEMTDEDKAIRDKYLERMKEIEEEHHTKIIENILDVVENFERHWN